MVCIEIPRLRDNWPNFAGRSPFPEEIEALKREVDHLDREMFALLQQRQGADGAITVFEQNLGFCKRVIRLPKLLLETLQKCHREVHKAQLRADFETAVANLRLAHAQLDLINEWGHECLHFPAAKIALTRLDQKQHQITLTSSQEE